MPLLTSLNSFWTFDSDNSNDSVGANNGTDTAITYSAGNGKVGDGAGFNGTSSKIVLTPAASLEPTASFSVSIWVKPTNGASDCAFLESLQQGAALGGFLVGMSGGKPRFLIGKNTGLTLNTDYKDITGNTTINDGNWHHVVFVYDGSNIIIYVDGSTDSTNANTISPVYSSPVCRIGCQGETGTDAHFYSGSLDALGLWVGRALTSGDVTKLYNSGTGLEYPFTGASPSASVSPSSSFSASVSPSSSISPSISPSSSTSASISPSSSSSPSASISPSSSSSASFSPSSSMSASISPSSSTSASPSAGFIDYTRGQYTNLPGNDTDLQTFYTQQEVLIVGEQDNIIISQPGELAYMVHQFKSFVGEVTFCELECLAQSTLAPAQSACYLQIYNHVSSLWETVDVEADFPANIDFELSGRIHDLANYKDTDKIISCRVYQLAI